MCIRSENLLLQEKHGSLVPRLLPELHNRLPRLIGEFLVTGAALPVVDSKLGGGEGRRER